MPADVIDIALSPKERLDSRVAEIISVLESQSSFSLDGRSVYPDRDSGLVWGVDAYGCDVLVCVDRGDTHACLERAARWLLNIPVFGEIHPAEKSW
jgi:hypothetical protein